jgi:hypothetical protein
MPLLRGAPLVLSAALLFCGAALAQTAPHALQLVAPAAGQRETLALGAGLEALRALGEVEVVACVGPFHSGKSFLLNNLLALEHPGKDGFAVGDTVDATTSGIWAWSAPAPAPARGGAAATPPPPATLYVDVEGFGSRNVTSDYDAKLFAIAAVLSGHLVMNSMHVISSEMADQLEVLAHKTQIFYSNAVRRSANRAAQAGRADVFDASRPAFGFPSLTWALQDFNLDLNGRNATSYVQSMVAGARKADSLGEEAASSSGFTALFRPTGFVLSPPTEKSRDLRRLRHLQRSELDEGYLAEVAELSEHVARELALTRAVREETRRARLALSAPPEAAAPAAALGSALVVSSPAAAAACASSSSSNSSSSACATLALAAAAGAKEALTAENAMISSSRPRTGSDLADIITQLVSAANDGSMPKVPSSWAALIKQQAGSAREAAVADAARRTDHLHVPSRPLSGAEFDAALRREHAAAESLYGHLVAGLSGAAVVDERAALKRQLAGTVEGAKEKNKGQIRAHCDAEAAQYRAAFAEFAKDQPVPAPRSAFKKALSTRKAADTARFRELVQRTYGDADTKGTVGDLQRFLDSTQAERERENSAALEQQLDAAKAGVKTAFTSFLAAQAVPQPSAAFKRTLDARREADALRFKADVERMAGEPDAKSALELETFLSSEQGKRVEANRVALEQELSAASAAGAAACDARAKAGVASLAGSDKDAPITAAALDATLVAATAAGLSAFDAKAGVVAKDETGFKGAQALVKEKCREDFAAHFRLPNVEKLQRHVERAANVCLGALQSAFINAQLPLDDAPRDALKKREGATAVDTCFKPKVADFAAEQAVKDGLARLRADVAAEQAELDANNDHAYTKIFRRPLERAYTRIEREANAQTLGMPGWLRAKAIEIASDEVGRAIDDGQTGGHAKPSPAQVHKSIAAWCDGQGVSPNPAKLIASADSVAYSCVMAVVAALVALAVAKAVQ